MSLPLLFWISSMAEDLLITNQNILLNATISNFIDRRNWSTTMNGKRMCRFDLEDDVFCRFGSMHNNWKRISNLSIIDKNERRSWLKITGREIMPDFPALLLNLNASQTSEFLLSDPLPVTTSKATLRADFWTSKNATIKLCIFDATDAVFVNCTKFRSSFSGKNEIYRPLEASFGYKNGGNYILIFQVNVKNGFVLLDDISYVDESEQSRFETCVSGCLNDNISPRFSYHISWKKKKLLADSLKRELVHSLINFDGFFQYTKRIWQIHRPYTDYDDTESICDALTCDFSDLILVHWIGQQAQIEFPLGYLKANFKFEPHYPDFAYLVTPTYRTVGAYGNSIIISHNGCLNIRKSYLCFHTPLNPEWRSCYTIPEFKNVNTEDMHDTEVNIPFGSSQ
uniref:Uncharacterized protein n=1 Tax=Romanomermis culicivorax TaxID=13658 RepID=A0A915LC03_ROMCU